MFSLPRSAARSWRAVPTIAAQRHHTRSLHQSTFLRSSQPHATELPLPNPRWVSNLTSKLRQSPNHEQLLEEVKTSAVGLMLGVEAFGTKPFHVEPVTWGDMDAMGESIGHVNNVRYNKWAESGRVDWVYDVVSSAPKEHYALFSNMMNPTGFGLILQEISTSFKFPLKYPDTVLIAHKLSQPMTPESTFMTVDAVIISEQHQRIAARFTEKISFYDYKAGKVAVVPPPLLQLMEERTADLLRIQQESRQKVRDLEAKVDRFVKGAA